MLFTYMTLEITRSEQLTGSLPYPNHKILFEQQNSIVQERKKNSVLQQPDLNLVSQGKRPTTLGQVFPLFSHFADTEYILVFVGH